MNQKKEKHAMKKTAKTKKKKEEKKTKKHFKHLTFNDRLTIEKMLKVGDKPTKIAKALDKHRSSIYREINRGRYIHTNSDLTTEERYSPDIAQEKYRESLKAKGPDLKIGNDQEYADYLEEKIAGEGYSPEAALGEIEEKGLKFKTKISKATLYSYIDMGLFRRLSNKDLPVKYRKKKKKKKVHRQKRASAGKSIEKRPPIVDTRERFGDWEMDTVIGKRDESKHSLLVLTERKTRYELIYLLPEHTTERVVETLGKLEAKWGDKFSTVFKTITVDNGSEFADHEGIVRSSLSDKERIDLFYCHPWCSFERGSNENANKLIRRKIPKGTNFDDKTEADIQEVEDWVNDYPRGIFGYKSARVMFESELSLLT